MQTKFETGNDCHIGWLVQDKRPGSFMFGKIGRVTELTDEGVYVDVVSVDGVGGGRAFISAEHVTVLSTDERHKIEVKRE